MPLAALANPAEYCKRQTDIHPVACIDQALRVKMTVRSEINGPFKRKGGYDYSRKALLGRSWLGDCEDYAVTLASALIRHDIVEPSDVRFHACQNPDPDITVGHLWVEVDGWFLDNASPGMSAEPPSWPLCREKTLAQVQSLKF